MKRVIQAVDRSFDVKACWSKAGIGTSILLQQRTQNNKGFKIALDLGCTPIFDQTIGASAVILSHGHIDHFGGIFSHARAHSLQSSGSVPSYYVPKHLVPKIEKAREIFTEIDATCCPDDFISNNSHRNKSLIAMNIIPIEAGVEVEIKQKKVKNGIRFFLRPFHVSHGGHPAYGYTIVSKTTVTQLKEEYQGLEGKDIGKLARSGIEIKETVVKEAVEVCYTGDTSVDGLTWHVNFTSSDESRMNSAQYLQQGFQAPIILCELTFLERKDEQTSKERGHLNIANIEEIFASHGWDMVGRSHVDRNRQLIFYHISAKHGPADAILQSLSKELPSSLIDISQVAISSFMSPSQTRFDTIMRENGCIVLRDWACQMEEVGNGH